MHYKLSLSLSRSFFLSPTLSLPLSLFLSPPLSFSAYRKDHSKKTAVLSVLDGLLVSADERLVSLVALLDLTAAFDTLDRTILLQRLEMTYGVRGTVLAFSVSHC